MPAVLLYKFDRSLTAMGPSEKTLITQITWAVKEETIKLSTAIFAWTITHCIFTKTGQACADHFAHESFLVRTEADGIEMTLEQLRSKTSDAAMFDAGGYMQYFV